MSVEENKKIVKGCGMELNKLTAMELQYHVEQLQGHYVECIDDDRLELWPEFFTEDCIYKIISRENHDRGLPAAAIFCDSKGMLEDRTVPSHNANIYAEHNYRHVLSNILIKDLKELSAYRAITWFYKQRRTARQISIMQVNTWTRW